MKTKRIQIVIFIVASLIAMAAPMVHPEYINHLRIGTYALVFISLYASLFCAGKILVWKKQAAKRIHLNSIDLVVLVSLLYFFIRYVTSKAYNLCPENGIVFMLGYLSYFVVRVESDRQAIPGSWIFYPILSFCILQCLYAYGQWFSILPNPLGFRLGGTYGNPGDLANVLLPGYALAIGLLQHEKKNWLKWVLGLSTMLILSVIILSMARTAWIAAFIISLFTFHKPLLKLKDIIFQKPLYYYPVLVLILVGIGVSLHKVYRVKQDSADGRLFIWKVCTHVIQEKPLFGHGFDSFKTTYSLAQANYFNENPSDNRNAFLADDILFAYNEYIQMTVEYGVLGLALCLVLVVLILIKKNTHPSWLPASLAIGSILLAMASSYPLRNGSILVILMLLIGHNANFDQSQRLVIKLPIVLKRGLLVIGLGISLVLCTLSIKVVHSSIIWKRTFDAHHTNPEQCLPPYQSLFNILKHDKGFLYHYGVMLNKWDKPAECIHHFEKYYMNCLDSKMLIIMGNCYEKLNNTTEAEYFYKQAVNAKPQLFVPRYLLFKLYEETNQETKALSTAQEISELKIKIYSQAVREIKTEISDYLIAKSLKEVRNHNL